MVMNVIVVLDMVNTEDCLVGNVTTYVKEMDTTTVVETVQIVYTLGPCDMDLKTEAKINKH